MFQSLIYEIINTKQIIMELIKIKKSEDGEEKTVEVNLFAAYVITLLAGWFIGGLIDKS